MDSNNVCARLKAFQEGHNAATKGPLSLLIQLTRMVRSKSFPLSPEDFKTENEGQVSGLGGGNLKKILRDHGITQILSSEGGRTSRGSMKLAREYFEFLNAWQAEEEIDFDAVEAFWHAAYPEIDTIPEPAVYTHGRPISDNCCKP